MFLLIETKLHHFSKFVLIVNVLKTDFKRFTIKLSRGCSLTMLTNFCPLLTTYLPTRPITYLDICDGIPFLL